MVKIMILMVLAAGLGIKVRTGRLTGRAHAGCAERAKRYAVGVVAVCRIGDPVVD